MSFNSGRLASIHPVSLITTLEADQVFSSLNAKEIEYILMGFLRIDGQVLPPNLSGDKAFRLSVELHETRHFHDILFTSYGVLQFFLRYQKYLNYCSALLPKIFKNKRLILPLNEERTRALFSEDNEAENVWKALSKPNDYHSIISAEKGFPIDVSFFVENIAHSIQMGFIENSYGSEVSFTFQKYFINNAFSINPNLRKYVSVAEILVTRALERYGKDMSQIVINNTGLLSLLSSILMFEFPLEKANSIILKQFREILNNIEKYSSLNGNYLTFLNGPNWNRMDDIISNNTQFIKNYFDKLLKREIPESLQPLLNVMFKIMEDFLKNRNILLSSITPSDLFDGNKYLIKRTTLPKNPVVIVSRKGFSMTSEIQNQYNILLGNRNKAFIITPIQQSYHNFNESWLSYFQSILPVESLFTDIEKIKKDPMAVLLLNDFKKIGIQVEYL